MSRIGRKPIIVEKGIEVKIANDNEVTVKGSKGTLTRTFHKDMIINVQEDADTKKTIIIVQRPNEERFFRSLHGLTRTLINNMIVGVSQGYERILEIYGVGYRAQKQGEKLIMHLGYTNPVEVDEIPGITIDVPAPNTIVIKGINKELVGEFAAKVREKRKPDAYKGKGVRYKGEKLIIKEGKKGKK